MIKDQSGQAMMTGLIMVLSILVAASFSYQIGRLIQDKSTLMIATDAAAFSVAQEQASVLNTLAYLNRAHIAHQVALAHLVTMLSAEKFRQKQSVQSTAHNPPATLIGILFGPHHAAAYVASNAGNGIGFYLPEQLRTAYQWHDQTVHGLIARSQNELLNSWENRRDQVFEEALSKNLISSRSNNVMAKKMHTTSMHPNMLKSTLMQIGVEWKVIEDQTKQKVVMQAGNSEVWLSMLESVVKTQSYLNDRNFTVKNNWVIHPRCPWRRHVLRRNGETRLAKSGTWKAEDTLSFHAVRSNKWIGCYMREYPMGWSMINPAEHRQESHHAPQNFSKEAYWKWLLKREGSTRALKSYGRNRLASAWSNLDSIHLGGKGPGHYAVLNERVGQQDNRLIAIKYEIKRKLSSFPFAGVNDLNRSDWSNKYAKGLPPLHLSTQSSSEAFFANPGQSKSDDRSLPSIFMPYWQGRISGTNE